MSNDQGRFSDVDFLIHVSTGVEMRCPVCDRGVRLGGDHWQDGVNHLLQIHAYRLLHVGSQWAEDRNGRPVVHTVAVLGRI